MSKTLKNSNLTQHPATRALVAVSLSFSLAAFGCTTDRTVGNGSPVTAPGVRNTPTSGTSTGTESSPTTPPSMTSSSSYVGAQALPTVQRRAVRVSAAEAAALLAQQQPRVRYLGPAYPAGTQSGSASANQVTGQFQNPALRTNPQITVNSTISSQPTAAVLSGAGGTGGSGGGVAAGAFVGGSTSGGGFTADSVAAGTGLGIGGNAINSGGSAPIFTNAPAGLSPVAATGLPIGTLGTTGSPAAFSAVAPSPLISTSPGLAQNTVATQSALANGSAAANAAAGANIGTVGTANTGTTGLTLGGNTNGTTANALTTTNGTTNTTNANNGTTANATTNATGGTTTGRLANPVRVTRDANGRAIITNTTTTNRR